MKIGVLGGTFDPPHMGHLIIAEEARVRLPLERVIFVPAGQPWMKAQKAISPGHHRLQMLRLAITSNPFFTLSTLEVERPGPSYSVETIAALREELGPQARLYFILGFDALAELSSWKEPQRLVEQCGLVAVRRPGYRRNLAVLEEALPGVSRCLITLSNPQIGINATEIRRRVAQGLSIRYLVPGEVEEYIKRHQLYAGTGN